MTLKQSSPVPIGAILFCATCWGLVSCDEPGTCPYDSRSSSRVLFSMNPLETNPFPWDGFSVADAGTRTGRRLSIPENGTPLLNDALDVLGRENSIRMLNLLDGFSILAPITIPLSGAIDPQSLPATPEDSLAIDSSVFLVDISPESPGYNTRIPIAAQYRFSQANGLEAHFLVASPATSLLAKTKYVLVITRGVLGVDNYPLGQSPASSLVCGTCAFPKGTPQLDDLTETRRELEPLFDELHLADRDRVALAFTFTTQSVQDELLDMLALLRSQPLPTPAADLDPNQDGAPDLYDPETLPFAPTDIDKREFIGKILRGTFESPQFRNSAGAIELAADGAPVQMGVERIPFLLVLPTNETMQPFPVVVVQHGNNARKENALHLAGYLAEMGMASIAMDFVEHGERPNTGHAFVNFTDMTAARADFQQSVVDQTRLLQVLRTMGSLPFDVRGTNQGSVLLDLGRIAYIGESLGTLVGVLTVSQDPSISVLVLNVPGARFSSIVRAFVGSLFSEDILFRIEILGQTLADRIDPVHYSAPFLPGQSGQPDKQILMQEGINDSTMPNAATEYLARALNCPLISPYFQQIEGLSIISLPATHRGLFQFQPAKHGGFIGGANEYPLTNTAMRKQATIFVDSFFKGQPAKLINPWE